MKKFCLLLVIIGIATAPALGLAADTSDQLSTNSCKTWCQIDETELEVTTGHGNDLQLQPREQERHIVIWDEWNLAHQDQQLQGASPGQASINYGNFGCGPRQATFGYSNTK